MRGHRRRSRGPLDYRILTPPDRPAPEPPTATTILLFDQDGHPAVPTCAAPTLSRAAAVQDARRASP